MPRQIIRILYLVIGSSILGCGLALVIASGSGGDAISVCSQGIGKVLHISIGSASILYYGFFCIPVIILTKERLGIGTVVSPIISAIILDFLLPYFSSQSVWVNTCYMLLGLLIIGIGLGMYVYADLGCSSYDGCILYISEKKNIPLAIIKATGDMLLCGIGYLLGGTMGIGPVLAIIIIGPVLQKTLTILNRQKQKKIAV
jgi:uncharacterized membrane protein YczE